MTALYREFPLRSESGWTAIVAFLRGNAKAVWGRGKFLRIIITEDESKRSSEANRFYWGVVLTQIADNAWLNGRQYSKDVWHEYLAQSYLPKEEMVLPDGEIIQRRKSTTELTVAEFAEYTEKCRAYAAVDLGVEILD